MKAMIFCAGLGTRLKPITDNIPKALLPLNGKTLLEHQIEKLRSAGITDIVVNVHHFPDMICQYLAEHHNFGCNIMISDEREMLLDTGGGLRKAAALLQGDSVLALNVDILSNLDIASLIAAHQADDIATLVVSERETQRYLLFDQHDQLRGWTNLQTGGLRPDTLTKTTAAEFRRLAFSGMQVLSPHIFVDLDEVAAQLGQKFSLIDLYLYILNKKSIRAYIPQNYKMMDVGKISQLAQAETFASTL